MVPDKIAWSLLTVRCNLPLNKTFTDKGLHTPIPHTQNFKYGSCRLLTIDIQHEMREIKPARWKVASTKQFIGDSTFSRWRVGSPEVATALRWRGSFLLRARVLGHGPVVSNGGCFQSYGELLPPVGKGIFWPYKVCTWTVQAVFPAPLGEGLTP